MATAKELFEKFLDQEADNKLSYHLHTLEWLKRKRSNAEGSLTVCKMALEQKKEETPLPHHMNDFEDELDEIDAQTKINDAMDKVLAIAEDDDGFIITKGDSEKPWYEQEPVYWTPHKPTADWAVTFFNAHAIITAPEAKPFNHGCFVE